MIKKLLFLILISFFGQSTLKAQSTAPTILNVTAFDSCQSVGNLLNVYANFNYVSSSMSAKVHWGDGSSNTLPISILQSQYGQIITAHFYTLPGTYTIMVELLDPSLVPLDSFTTTKNTFCNSIRGFTYKRGDANCTYDGLVDHNINGLIQIEIRENNVPIDTIDSYNQYYYSIPNASYTAEYSLHPLNSSLNLNAACPLPSSPLKFRLDTIYYNNNEFNFGYDCGSATSYDLFTYGNGFFRPVANSFIYLTAGNQSCLPQSGTLTLQLSPKYSFVSSGLNIPSSISGQTITWNLSNLDVSNSKHITVQLSPVGTLSLGDTVMNTLTITPNTGDINVANNSVQMIDSIRASFDPNEKDVVPAGNIASGEKLTYTIHFENLGNDTAFNVHVIDTLSQNVDPSSMKLLYSSHAVDFNMYQRNGYHIARFDFPNIMLADSSDRDHNKGFFVYEINAKNTMNEGDEIQNTAHIFFDINPAIVTNTTVNKIPTVNIKDFYKNENSLEIYPNPAKDYLMIKASKSSHNKIVLKNVLGQTVKTTTLHNGINLVDIKEIPAGVYFVISDTHSQNQSSVYKLIVEQ